MHPLEQDLNHVLEHTREIWDTMRGERLFITGGTGFVGTWLVESFIWANRRLDLGAKAILLSRRAASALQDQAIEYLTGDGTTFDYPAGAVPFVIHAATEKAQGGASFVRDIKTTERVLDFARTHDAKRLLFTSSGAIYGSQPPEMSNLLETYNGAPPTTDIDSAYAQGKRASEYLFAEFGAVIARLFAFVGPYLPLDANYAVGNFIGNVLRSEPVRITGDGTPYRSYLYAADLAIWLWTLLLRGQCGLAYNVGSPDAITIRALAETVIQNTRPETPIEIMGTPQPGMASSRYVPSVARAEKELGLRVLIPLGEGVRRTYQWHLR